MFEKGSEVPSVTLTVTQELLNQGCLAASQLRGQDRRVDPVEERAGSHPDTHDLRGLCLPSVYCVPCPELDTRERQLGDMTGRVWFRENLGPRLPTPPPPRPRVYT